MSEGYLRHGLFFAHLAVEKILKAQGKWDKIIARYGLADLGPEAGGDS